MKAGIHVLTPCRHFLHRAVGELYLLWTWHWGYSRSELLSEISNESSRRGLLRRDAGSMSSEGGHASCISLQQPLCVEVLMSSSGQSWSDLDFSICCQLVHVLGHITITIKLLARQRTMQQQQRERLTTNSCLGEYCRHGGGNHYLAVLDMFNNKPLVSHSEANIIS